jgi:hypothetical protein
MAREEGAGLIAQSGHGETSFSRDHCSVFKPVSGRADTTVSSPPDTPFSPDTPCRPASRAHPCPRRSVWRPMFKESALKGTNRSQRKATQRIYVPKMPHVAGCVEDKKQDKKHGKRRAAIALSLMVG